MNKKLILTIIIILIISFTVSINFVIFTQTDGEVVEVLTYNCEEDYKLYTSKIKTKCINSIKVKFNRQVLELSEYLQKNRSIEEVLSTIDDVTIKENYTVYKVKGVTFIKCSNMDVFIGKDIENDDKMCYNAV